MYKIGLFVPKSHLESVKKALFDAGAGRYENYDSCSWEIKGHGQFRPLKGSTPYIGKIGEIEKISEYRVEMICQDHLIKDVIKALKKHHPYETPAYNVLKLENF